MDWWPLGLYALLVVLAVASVMTASYLIGERHARRTVGGAYESGIESAQTGRARFPAQFYLIAMFFVIFDLEAVYLFAWAVAAPEAGWTGFGEAIVFVAVLLAALAYLWRCGALDWGTSARIRAQTGGRRG